MSERSVHRVLAIGVACVALILSLGITALAGLRSESSHEEIEGSWMETITSTDGSFPPFHTLFTYGAGGGAVGTASIDMTPGLKSGPTHGAWKHLDGQRFSLLAHAFSFDDAGLPNGTFNIRGLGTLGPSGDTYTATCSFEVVNGTGAFPPLGCTVTAVRIKP